MCTKHSALNCNAFTDSANTGNLSAPYKELIQSYSSIMSSSVAFQLSQLSESLNSAIHDNVRAGLYSTLSESLKNAFPYHELQQQI